MVNHMIVINIYLNLLLKYYLNKISYELVN